MPRLIPRKDPYRRHESRIEYQLFSSEYYSGADMHIYFGDIWVDEITSLDFSLQEQILPIYGYHSYTYDAIARGRRIVQGSFSINFTSVGYLQTILEYAEPLQFAVNQVKSQNASNVNKKLRLDEVLRLYGKESFEEIAEEYERAIWGDASESQEEQYLAAYNAPYFQRNQKMGFDIYIYYGAVSDPLEIKKRHTSSKLYTPSSTIEVINGVQITGVSKRASTELQAMPIQEVYTFMARDINGATHPN